MHKAYQKRRKSKVRAIVGGLIVKQKGKDYFIMTQKRKVLFKAYDPLYDGTWEGMGETLLEGENVLEALLRGCREEFGHSAFKPKRVIGTNDKIWTTGVDRKDKFICPEPFCFVQSLGPPRPWIGPFFVVEVAEDFEPNYEAGDGEATFCKWWDPVELKKHIEECPQDFMGLHIAPLYKLCLTIIEKREI